MRQFLTTSALALSLLLPQAGAAFDLLSMSADERSAFREEVRAYLLENPEVLMEAFSVLEARQAEEQALGDREMVAANLADLHDTENSWVGGNPDGDVTLVEFIDYRCGYCRRAFPEVEELVASDGNVRLIVKEFPILGEQSVLSSRFAIATRLIAGDDAYKAAHDALISLRGDATPGAMRDIAAEIGVDADAVMGALNDPRVDAVIAENRALAQRMQINGTPTFVMGDQLLRGYVPLDGMRELLSDQRG